MATTVALLYAEAPSGHSAAAAALKERLPLLDPAARCAEIILSRDLHPVLGPLVSRAYLELVRRTPRLWHCLYDNARVAGALLEFEAAVTRRHRRRLRERVEAEGADVIVCTHALPCAALALERGEGALRRPLAAVLTDFGVHAYWISRHVDLYLAPTAATRGELARRGVDPSRVKVTGIPVDPRLRSLPAKRRAREALGLDPKRPTVLLEGGSKGLGPLREEAADLLELVPEVQVLALCGANAALLKSLAGMAAASGGRLKALPQTREVPLCLAASDLLVGKAGGVTASEALAAGVPLLVVAPLPGQEERNASVLVAAGAAQAAAVGGSLAEGVRRLLSRPRELESMARAARRLGRPDSADSAAREILALAAPSGACPSDARTRS